MKPYLKPCPFCGNKAPIIRSNSIGDYYVICDTEEILGCGVRTNEYYCETEEFAAERWNKRVRRRQRRKKR